jgi:hypothetical protein
MAADIELGAWETNKGRFTASYVFQLEQRPGYPGYNKRGAAKKAAQQKLGRSHGYVSEQLRKYKNDPECRAGEFVLPVLPRAILNALKQALTATDPPPPSGKPRRPRRR